VNPNQSCWGIQHRNRLASTSIQEVELFDSGILGLGIYGSKNDIHSRLLIFHTANVQSIFGITTFTIQPKWYLVYAFPILIGTITLAFVFGRIITWWDNFRASRARTREDYPDEERGYELLLLNLGRPRGRRQRSSHRLYPPTNNEKAALVTPLQVHTKSTRRRSSREYATRGVNTSRVPSGVIERPDLEISERRDPREPTFSTHNKRSSLPGDIPTTTRDEGLPIPEDVPMPRGRPSPSMDTHISRGLAPVPLFLGQTARRITQTMRSLEHRGP
jgi:hypothetical protein